MNLGDQRYLAECPTCGDELVVVLTMAVGDERLSEDRRAVTYPVEMVGVRVDAPCGHVPAEVSSE